MQDYDGEAEKRRSMRIVQLLVILSGVSFVIVGAVILLALAGSDQVMMLLGTVLMLAGFGDMIVAFFVFRGASESTIPKPTDLRKQD